MEHLLRCNIIKCRSELRERALVTTCSHIFCIDCANSTGLNDNVPENRLCPACQTHLPNPDDAVITNLCPSENYKTSVLSGLSPDTIMECAGRALSFWSYQISQDLVWETHRCKVLTTRYYELNAALDNTINNANTQLTNAQNKIVGLSADQDDLRRKNEELSQAYKEKTRKLLQVQELYDKLKRKAMLGHIQDAAYDAVDTTLHGVSTSDVHPEDHVESQRLYDQSFGTPFGAPRYTDRPSQPAAMSAHSRMVPPDIRNANWERPTYPRDGAPSTPSAHRQRPGAGGASLSTVPGLVAGTPISFTDSRHMRQPLYEIQPNQRKNLDTFSGAGLSSRLKTSQVPHTAGSFVPTVRPRVAQGASAIGLDFNRTL